MAEERVTTKAADVLIHLARQVRQAESNQALQFLLVNQTHQLVPYLLGILWVEDEGVVLQSGVSHIERNSPYILWLKGVLELLSQHEACQQGAFQVEPDMLSEADVAEWSAHLPETAIWLPIVTGKRKAGLLLCREPEFSEIEMAYLREWVDTWAYAWRKLDVPSVYGELMRFWLNLTTAMPTREQLKSSFNLLLSPQHVLAKIKSAGSWLRAHGFKGALQQLAQEVFVIWRNKKRRWKWLIAILVLLPVRLSVLVPGELVPANPAIIRVPVEGVVDAFYVSPNQHVVKGQPLFKLDPTSTMTRLQVARQETQIANQEYRQSALQGLTDAKSREMMVPQQGRALEKAVEADYLNSMLEKTNIKAPRDGLVLFDDPSEWIGKPVVAGEKVMVVATEGDAEVEAWIPVGEALELPKDSSVTLYLNAMPFSPLTAKLRYEGYEPILRPDATYAYRVRATLLSGEQSFRVGLKGTAKLQGHYVPFAYWVLRRPMASLRQFLGL
jgi:hypothetical protein